SAHGNLNHLVHLNRYGICLENQLRFDEAESQYREALAICRKSLRPMHPDTGWTLYCLGALLDIRGKPEQAEPLLCEALSIRRQVLPAEDPDITATANELAACFMIQHKFAEAEPLLLGGYADLIAKP